MKLERKWAMPNKNTFDIKPIKESFNTIAEAEIDEVDDEVQDPIELAYLAGVDEEI